MSNSQVQIEAGALLGLTQEGCEIRDTGTPKCVYVTKYSILIKIVHSEGHEKLDF